MPKLLILLGAILILVGVAWLVGERFGLGRLPGDLKFEFGNVRIYLPLATSLVLSAILTLALWLLRR
jgi:hypothetical protein